MDPNTKKTALRMIPYGLYVLTGEASDGCRAEQKPALRAQRVEIGR